MSSKRWLWWVLDEGEAAAEDNVNVLRWKARGLREGDWKDRGALSWDWGQWLNLLWLISWKKTTTIKTWFSTSNRKDCTIAKYVTTFSSLLYSCFLTWHLFCLLLKATYNIELCAASNHRKNPQPGQCVFTLSRASRINFVKGDEQKKANLALISFDYISVGKHILYGLDNQETKGKIQEGWKPKLDDIHIYGGQKKFYF